METMDKQKSKYGIIEIMPNGQIYGYVNVIEMSDRQEELIVNDYIDMGYLPTENNYSLVGGSVDTIDFRYMDEDGIAQEGEMPYVNHGILLMKTSLKKYVPTEDK
tara:strand:- start:281 stop:595 length:315 start_codon:yes stop_codon:yes gene_type:complete